MLSEADACVVAEICVRLDGLPLALELAAARMKVLPPSMLLDSPRSAPPVSSGGARDLPPRQQTLRATIDWSYSLLHEVEQGVFGRLSVFVGGCTLAAAESVCDATIEVLESLVDKSLLHIITGDEELRFTMVTDCA